jgi:hypothetical protein
MPDYNDEVCVSDVRKLRGDCSELLCIASVRLGKIK